MIIIEPNSGRTYELRTWRFKTGVHAATWFLDVSRAQDKQVEREHGFSIYRHLTGGDHYVTLVGQEDALDEIMLPRAMGGEEVDDLDGDVLEPMLQRRLRVEAQVTLDRLDGREDREVVRHRLTFGHRGGRLTPDGNVDMRPGGDQ